MKFNVFGCFVRLPQNPKNWSNKILNRFIRQPFGDRNPSCQSTILINTLKLKYIISLKDLRE